MGRANNSYGKGVIISRVPNTHFAGTAGRWKKYLLKTYYEKWEKQKQILGW
jgi:hypothetical protein